jgi:hypothetical protein
MNNKNIFKKVIASTLAIASAVGVGIGIVKTNMHNISADAPDPQHWTVCTNSANVNNNIADIYGGDSHNLVQYERIDSSLGNVVAHEAYGIGFSSALMLQLHQEGSDILAGSATKPTMIWAASKGYPSATKYVYNTTDTSPNGQGLSALYLPYYKQHLYRLDGKVAYCFDYTTADKNGGSNYPYVMSSSLDAAQIPHDNQLFGYAGTNRAALNTEELIMKTAKAAQFLSMNNFAWFKDPANMSLWIKDIENAQTYTHGGVSVSNKLWVPSLNRYATVEDIYNAALSAGDRFYETLVQFMVWNTLNGNPWSTETNTGNIYGYVVHGTGGQPTTIVDKDGNVHTSTSSEYWGITPGGIFKFPEMLTQGWENFNNASMEMFQTNTWVSEYSFEPGESITIYPNETYSQLYGLGEVSGRAVIRYLQELYPNAPSTVCGNNDITIRFENNTAILQASENATPSDWSGWDNLRGGGFSLFSTAPYQLSGYERNNSENFGSTLNNNTGAGQFIVDCGALKMLMVRVRVTQPDNNEGYAYIKKTVPSGYSAQGATFGLYASQADANADNNRITTLVIGTDGNSPAYSISMGTATSTTLWAKELTAPTQSGANFEWIMDNSPKQVTVTTDNTAENPAEFAFTNNVKEYGWGQVHKSAPTGYSPIGAEYTLYSDANAQTPLTADKFANNTVQKFTIDAEGNSNKIKFNVPTGGTLTVYVKETKLPNPADNIEWEWDTTIHTLNITVGKTESKPAMVNSFDGVTEQGYGKIVKRSDVPSMQNAVDGAVFTLLTTDGQIVNDVSGNPVVLTIVNGESDTFAVLTGDYILRETTVPEGFAQANDTPITITVGETTTVTISNHYLKGQGRIHKTVSDDVDINEFPVEGITFTVYTNNKCTEIARDILTGQPVILTVSANGDTNVANLAFGTYYVKETWCPDYFTISTEIKTLVINSETTIQTVDFHNALNMGIGRVEKKLG